MRRKMLGLILAGLTAGAMTFSGCAMFKGEDGSDGKDGVDGKSAYQIWLDNGHEGTETDFLAWLKGKNGIKGEQGVGIKKVELSEYGNLIITYTDGTTQTVRMPDTSNQDSHAHAWGNGIILKDATSTEEGAIIYVCDCGEAKYEVIARYSDGLNYTLNADGISYSVTGIGSCSDTDIAIPSVYEGLPVTSIGYCAFNNCDTLTSVAIPNSVVNIGDFAFTWCDLLRCIEIPSSVVSMGEGVFAYCTSLTSITVSKDNVAYQSIDGNLYTKDGKSLIQYAIGKTDEFFTIPNSVTGIGTSAFSDCDFLTNMVIPNSVTSIGSAAFFDCNLLISVNIGNSVTCIDNTAFSACNALTSVVIGGAVTDIGKNAFSSCDVLTNIYYNGTAETWGAVSIGLGNSNLTNATIYYYSETEASGCWRYVDGVPVLW